MDLFLTRHVVNSELAAGLLMAPGVGIYASMERGWNPSGKPGYDWGRVGASCVPCGEYELVYTRSPRFGMAWHLRDSEDGLEGLTVDKTPESDRWDILFHSANFAHQLKGCPALGVKYAPSTKGTPGGLPAMVTQSKWAVKDFTDGLLAVSGPDAVHRLIIEESRGTPWPT